MCGLIGWFGRNGAELQPSALGAALDRMQRRGPDGEGRWTESGVSLGHRRLAILDLEARAAQPMHSPCGRYVIAYNGEIYNFRALRSGLERSGMVFRTESDTEVILALFAAEREAMLPKLHGMFAFVIWDKLERRAFAARDPYGIKPLYLAKASHGLLVGSQVKALMATGLVAQEPCIQGQAGFWMLGSVPEPYTWYKAVSALPAGHFAWITDGAIAEQKQWWDIGSVWRNAGSVEQGADVQARVREALVESVSRHLVSDVPVGVFLSGGIDSGALAGLMAEAGASALTGITIAYDEFQGTHDDEAPLAKELASYYGLQHKVRRVCREEFWRDLPRIVDAMDQPSIDGVNTWYASKAVAEAGLKVVVSGVGGDELFQGYSSFRTLPRLLAWGKALDRIPFGKYLLRAAGAAQARRTSNTRWRHLEEWSHSIGGAWWLRRSVCAPEDLALVMGEEAARIALEGFRACVAVTAMAGQLAAVPTLALGQIESSIYMRNQLLRDSDWASMDHSVELRTPLVDAHLLEQIQPCLNEFSMFPKKSLLAMAPQKPLPASIRNRRKTGFGIPVSRWLAARTSNREHGFSNLVWARYLAKEFGSACGM